MALPDLTNIDPIDDQHVRELKEQVSNDASLFNRLYSIFQSEGPELIGQLRELLPKGVHSDIHDVIHKIKGSSAAMGATRIHSLASAAVEVCRKEGELSELSGLPDWLEKEYEGYLEDAKRFLSD